MDAISKAAIQLSVFRNSDRARVVAREACMQLKELQNISDIFQWDDKCGYMGLIACLCHLYCMYREHFERE